MKKLDLHGTHHEECKNKVLIFIENNIDNLPIEIITGNSLDMQLIVEDVVNLYGLRYSYPHHKNLGSLIISDTY